MNKILFDFIKTDKLLKIIKAIQDIITPSIAELQLFKSGWG